MVGYLISCHRHKPIVKGRMVIFSYDTPGGDHTDSFQQNIIRKYNKTIFTFTLSNEDTISAEVCR